MHSKSSVFSYCLILQSGKGVFGSAKRENLLSGSDVQLPYNRQVITSTTGDLGIFEGCFGRVSHYVENSSAALSRECFCRATSIIHFASPRNRISILSITELKRKSWGISAVELRLFRGCLGIGRTNVDVVMSRSGLVRMNNKDSSIVFWYVRYVRQF